MPHRLAPYVSDLFLYGIGAISGLSAGVRTLFAQAVPPAQGGDPGATLNGGTAAMVAVAVITASTPLILRAVDIVRAKDAIRQYRHYSKNLEQSISIKDGEIRMLRDAMLRASRKYDFDLPDWFFEDPEPAPTKPSGPILPPVVTPTPDPDGEPRREERT